MFNSVLGLSTRASTTHRIKIIDNAQAVEHITYMSRLALGERT